jgi:hypothetical protein
LISKTALVLLGVPIGLSIALAVPAEPAEPILVNVVCESFEGEQGVAGKDGKDGLNGTVRFTHVPQLEGLFHEQNVRIEYHD